MLHTAFGEGLVLLMPITSHNFFIFLICAVQSGLFPPGGLQTYMSDLAGRVFPAV